MTPAVNIILAGALQRDLLARGVRQFSLGDCEAMVARMLDSVRIIERHTRPEPARRCETELVAHDGSCEACGAISGEACQAPRFAPVRP